MTDSAPAAVVVLAAGEGKRMKSELAKVLHAICGRSLLGHVLVATQALEAARTVVVIGNRREQLLEHLNDMDSSAATVVQEQQLGTGHAVRIALDSLDGLTEGTVIVVPGDVPLLTAKTLQRLVARHAETSAVATVLSAEVPDPTGYGRVVRSADGHVTAIVEDRDADTATKQVHEINTSVYAFDVAKLRAALSRLTTDNAQGEEYLTDVIGLLVGDGEVVVGVTVDDYLEALGVNDRVQLAVVRRAMRDQIVHALDA